MCICFCAKFQVSSIILTSFRQWVVFPSTSKQTPKKPTQIKVKARMVMANLLSLLKSQHKNQNLKITREHFGLLETIIEAFEHYYKTWDIRKIMNFFERSGNNLKRVKDNKQAISNSRHVQKCIHEIRKRNIDNAMILLRDNVQNGVLPLNMQTLRQLKKHLQGSKADAEVLSDIPEKIHPLEFDLTNEESVTKATLNTRG